MSYILRTNLVSNEQVEIALTRIFGIGLKKAIQVCDQALMIISRLISWLNIKSIKLSKLIYVPICFVSVSSN